MSQEPGLIPRKVLFGNPERASVKLSHDGARISFLAPVDGVMNVWVAPVDAIDPTGHAFKGSWIHVLARAEDVPGLADSLNSAGSGS